MRLSQYIDQRPTKRKTSKKGLGGTARGIAAHRSFVPMVTLWGASLLGLTVAVLPADAIARVSVLTGTGILGQWAMPAYAGAAALLGGGLGFVISSAFRDRTRNREDNSTLVTAVHSRRERVIDPTKDLGSESLDAPIEDVSFDESEPIEEAPAPTLGELAKRGYEMEPPEDCSASDDDDDASFTRKHFRAALIETCEAEGELEPFDDVEDAVEDDDASMDAQIDPEPAPEPAQLVVTKAKRSGAVQPIGRPGTDGVWSLTQYSPPPPAPTETVEPTEPEPPVQEQSEAPRALDLGEFAELPGRNAVWVEEEAVEETGPSVEAPSASPSSALERLRQKNPEELSLVEMVERFAGALHEHQAAEAKRPTRQAPGRDAALAEALKALTLFTQNGFDQAEPGNGTSASDQIGETERELRNALARLQTLSGAA